MAIKPGGKFKAQQASVRAVYRALRPLPQIPGRECRANGFHAGKELLIFG
jgi:hypothetical protein